MPVIANREQVPLPAAHRPYPLPGEPDGRMLRPMCMKRLLPFLVLAPLLVGCAGEAAPNLAADSPSRPTSPAATPVSSPRTGPVEHKGSAASCVEGYSTETLLHRAFAFDGTIVAIGPGGTNKPDMGQLDTAAVTFKVNEWFKGGVNDTVTVDLLSPTSNIAGDDTPAYERGTRLLVSGEPRWDGEPLEDAIAWSCGGFTSYYEQGLADEWRTATA